MTPFCFETLIPTPGTQRRKDDIWEQVVVTEWSFLLYSLIFCFIGFFVLICYIVSCLCTFLPAQERQAKWLMSTEMKQGRVAGFSQLQHKGHPKPGNTTLLRFTFERICNIVATETQKKSPKTSMLGEASGTPRETSGSAVV